MKNEITLSRAAALECLAIAMHELDHGLGRTVATKNLVDELKSKLSAADGETEEVECEECGGSGEIDIDLPTADVEAYETCEKCSGTGKVKR